MSTDLHKYFISEIVHWFCNQRETDQNIHPTETEGTQVQSLENGRFHAIRLFHYGANRFEYLTVDDEGKKNVFLIWAF